MNIRDMEIFAQINAYGSISAAAENLHLSQPAISRRIGVLEKDLGYELFERIGPKLVLTPAGKVFLKYCISFMADMKEMEHAIRSVSENLQTFTVGMVDVLAETRLSLVFRHFCQMYPLVDIKLYTATNDKITEMVANGLVDLGIKYFQDNNVKNLEQIKIGNEQLAIIAAYNSQYIKEPHSIQQLADAKWITFPKEDPFGSIIASFQHYNRLLYKRTVSRHLEIGSLTMQKRLVEADLGLCILPLYSVADEVQSRKLQVLQTPMPEINFPIIAQYRVTSPVIEFIEIFLDLTSME
ncbi:LysR family transcriptional regulator [Paenibacillus campi]|uniref:LysR family transcriptional regulator n=1 Tax=Paenibacillus campi TaxID=3106031 RepID=UPI002AFDE7F1|nr:MULTISPECIES: LysR family transcriptional regulator [unclassified Paenibacillus]